MQGDNPTIIKLPTKTPFVKSSWTESAFEKAFNQIFVNKYSLLKCSQDYNTFDFWLLNLSDPRQMPAMIELKTHLSVKHDDREMVGCDLIKANRMKSLAVNGCKAYVFHLFKDLTLVQDIDTPIANIRKVEWANKEVLLALISRQSAVQKIGIGLDYLLTQQSS
jgi:hypothetical protein